MYCAGCGLRTDASRAPKVAVSVLGPSSGMHIEYHMRCVNHMDVWSLIREEMTFWGLDTEGE